jgi:SAM-dependent methyltransferase
VSDVRYQRGAFAGGHSEWTRTPDLLRLIPESGGNVLDIGARDGYFTRILAERFHAVTALDLERPAFELDRVTTIGGDVRALPFADNEFDCVFCTEVLEHVPGVAQACLEITRVARTTVIIGVPYQQDTREGQMTCRSCGGISPPFGHVNSFDEARLRALFPGLKVEETSLLGESNGVTNSLSAWLMTRGGNPWGTYNQEEPCIHCGARLTPPAQRSFGEKVCSALADRINRVQRRCSRPHPNWIHVRFRKP